MKEIYFAKEDAGLLKRFSRNLIYYSSDTFGRGFPELTANLAEKVLCTPNRSSGNLQATGFETRRLKVRDQELQVYSQGDGDKTIVFSHGWSGNAGNFSSFFQPFLDKGYRVVAFDHVAHGQSTGQHANLFMFIKGLRTVLDWVKSDDEIVGIIAHSMGGSAVISTLAKEESQIPLALLAPVVPLFESLKDSTDKFGLSRRWLQGLMQHLEKRYDMQIPDIDPKEHIKTLANPLLILHDQKDSYIPLEINKEFIPKHLLSSLETTQDLGHFRILKNANVVQKSVEFIANARVQR